MTDKEVEICIKCEHSEVGQDYIKCCIGIPIKICPIQFLEKENKQ